MTDTRWPASMQELLRLIGLESASSLVDAYGGTRCYVPRGPTARSPLAKAVGLQAARALAEEFGGEYILVPTCFHARSKKGEIAAAEGTNAAIARRFKVSDRWVRIVRNGEPDDRQMDIFSGGSGSS